MFNLNWLSLFVFPVVLVLVFKFTALVSGFPLTEEVKGIILMFSSFLGLFASFIYITMEEPWFLIKKKYKNRDYYDEE